MPRPSLLLNPSVARGFTLVELAVVLVIVSLLAGGLIMTVGSQVDQRQRSETRQQLEEARDALLGFAASHLAADGKPHLPCPDTDGDGLENRTGNACTNTSGTLPFVDLGLSRQDIWGNRLRYHVHANFGRNDIGFTFSTSSNLRICEQAACTTVLASGLPVIVLSGGRNGIGSGADEQENADGDQDYVSRVPSSADINDFDDYLIWLSPSVLYNRMIAAGRLP